MLRPTPLLPVQDVLVKAESRQPGGTVEVRGALTQIVALGSDRWIDGLVAFGADDRMPAFAWAAQELGIVATVVLPQDAPPLVVEAVRRFDAEIVLAGPAVAEQIAAERGATLIDADDDADARAGHATVVTEILRQLDDVPPAALFVPGRLAAGIAAAVAHLCPSTRVTAVAPQVRSGMRAARRRLTELTGRPVTAADAATLAAALEHGGAAEGPLVAVLAGGSALHAQAAAISA